jgi:heat shock protein HtpX
MFFANPLRGGGLAGLFSTHPPIEDRIKALREMKL